MRPHRGAWVLALLGVVCLWAWAAMAQGPSDVRGQGDAIRRRATGTLPPAELAADSRQTATPKPPVRPSTGESLTNGGLTQICISLGVGWNLFSFNLQPISNTTPIMRGRGRRWSGIDGLFTPVYVDLPLLQRPFHRAFTVPSCFTAVLSTLPCRGFVFFAGPSPGSRWRGPAETGFRPGRRKPRGF